MLDRMVLSSLLILTTNPGSWSLDCHPEVNVLLLEKDLKC